MPTQKSRKPTRKVWAGFLSAALTAIVANSGLDLSPETISGLSLGVGALIAYYVPAADIDLDSR
jgi:hypothetical protein